MTFADLVPQAVTLAGVLVGGGITYFVASEQGKHQARLEAQRRFIDKMESLHAELSAMSEQSNKLQLMMVCVMTEQHDVLKGMEKSTVSTSKLLMLVDYYAPQLRPEADEIQLGIQTLGEVTVSLVPERTQDKRNDLFAKGIKSNRQVCEAVERARNKLAKLVAPVAQIRS